MPGKVFVTGGSGFVGQAIIEELVSRGYAVNALTHRQSIKAAGEHVQSIKGGLFDPGILRDGMAGCDAVVHIVGIIMENKSKGITFERIHYEGAKNVIDAARVAGVKRYIHMSALGTRADAASTYHRTKFQAEEYARESGLDWTILRPSMIHGPAGEFMKMEAAWARHQKLPFFFMPYFGAGLFGHGGAGKLQPAYVKDVARAFVESIEKPQTIGEVFPLAGPDELTWPSMHQIISKAVTGKQARVFALPAWYAKAIAAITPPALLPFNRDQVIMSQEDNTCDMSKFKDAFGWETEPFEASVKSYAAML